MIQADTHPVSFQLVCCLGLYLFSQNSLAACIFSAQIIASLYLSTRFTYFLTGILLTKRRFLPALYLSHIPRNHLPPKPTMKKFWRFLPKNLQMSDFFCSFGTPLKGPSEITSRRCGAFWQDITRRKTELRSPFSCQGTCFYASISTLLNTKMHKNAIFLRVDLQMCICFRNFVVDFNRAHRAK